VDLMPVGTIAFLFMLLGASPGALDFERQLQFGQSNEMSSDFGTGICAPPRYHCVQALTSTGVQHWRFWNIIHMVKILGQVGAFNA